MVSISTPVVNVMEYKSLYRIYLFIYLFMYIHSKINANMDDE